MIVYNVLYYVSSLLFLHKPSILYIMRKELPGRLTADSISGDLVLIPHRHQNVHDAIAYTIDNFNTAVADASSLDTYINTTDKLIHLRFETQAGGDAVLHFYESPTVIAGTALEVSNRNRTSGATTSVLAYTGGTVSSAGLTLMTAFMPGGGGPLAAGGDAEAELEWLLKTDTYYLVRVTNVSGGNKRVHTQLHFYCT
jgi:hypothetical protein